MALPLTGPISLYDVSLELNGPFQTSISDYYRGNPNIPSRYYNTIPVSGTHSLQALRGVQGYRATVEDTFGYFNQANPSSREAWVDLGATSILPAGSTVRQIYKTVSLAQSVNRKSRWVFVAMTQFHWLINVAGANMFSNIRMSGGSGNLTLKSRYAELFGESHKSIIAAFPVADGLASIDLVFDLTGYYSYDGKGNDSLTFGRLWGEVLFTVFSAAGLPDTLSYRTAEDANFTSPNAITLTAADSGTTPKKSLAIVTSAGRQGSAGACTNTDGGFIQGGQGHYIDSQMNSTTESYTATHSTNTLITGVSIDF